MKTIKNSADFDKISYIYTEFKMNGYEMTQMSIDTIDKIVKRQLSNGLSDFIIKNMNKLPVKYMTNHKITTNHKIMSDVTTYRAEMIIIDKEELDRLKEIEWKYNDLCR